MTRKRQPVCYSRKGVNGLIQHTLETIDLPTVDLMQDEVACQFPSPGEIENSNLSAKVKAIRATLCGDVGDAPDVETAREKLFAFALALEEHRATMAQGSAP